ncbi:non-structural polyprotein [Marine RNA virus BC-1]|uniref:Non-structural polyprotein n=1 Tax=Marine RNA virus BC-1 TaxID=2315691 RepID=A0A386JC66_9VIRU|nr:non-structural polyprotein [Marine RNA virus BC-1]AYD68773.1 non-structural polyprotein [Marine RNA virus BC-1]
MTIKAPSSSEKEFIVTPTSTPASNGQMPTDRNTRSVVTPEDLTSYMNQINLVDSDYDCDWKGLSHEEITNEPWYIVEHKKRKKRFASWDLKIQQTIDLMDTPDINPNLNLDTKQANTACYASKTKGRRNIKELKRLSAKLRVIKRNERILKKKTEPHGLEDDYTWMHSGPEGDLHPTERTIPKKFLSPIVETVSDTDDEQKDESENEHHTLENNDVENDDDDPPLSHCVKERNDLFKLALSTPPQKPDAAKEMTDMLETISDIVPKETTPEMDEWVSHLENLVIMSYQVTCAQSFTDVFVAVIAYIKMNTSKSVLKSIFELIDEVTKACPAKDCSPQAFEANDVLQHWELFKSNKIFTKISYLLSAAISLSVCDMKGINWSPFGLKLIAVEAAKEQLKAVDVIDAVICTFTWVAETGYRVFEEKSLMPLLYSDNKMKDFNRDCDYVLANAEQALAGNLGEINDFEFKTDDVLRQVCEMKAVQNTGPTALWLQKRYSELVNIKHKIVAKHRNTAIRFAPFGVGITGPSGVGKSTLAKLVMKIALFAMGFKTDPKRIITKDMFDAYDSTYTSDILGMFMDDVGNGKSQFAQVSPTDIIIKFFNNMAAQAVKAELNAKGVVFIAFKVGVLTSNFPDYNVRDYACKPEASLRRFVHTRARILEKFRLPGGISLNTEHPDLERSDLTQDVWELDVEECHIYESKEGKDAYKFRIMNVKVADGRMIHCKNLCLSDYTDVIIALAKRHAKSQTNVMKRSNDFDTMDMCSTCCRPQPMCKCEIKPHGIEQLGSVIVDAATAAATSYVNKWLSPVKFLNTMLGYRPVKAIATRQLAQEMTSVLSSTATPWLIAATPQWIFDTSVFKKSIGVWQYSAAARDLKNHFRSLMSASFLSFGYSAYTQDLTTFVLTLIGSWIGALAYWSHHRARIKHYQQEYLSRREALPDFARLARDGKVVKGLFVASTLIVGLKLFRIWNKMRLSKLAPNSLTVDEVDVQPSWFGFMMDKMKVSVVTSENMKHSTPEQLTTAFRKNNLFWADFVRADGSRIRCNIFFPRKGVAWFPHHVFFPNSDMTGTPTSLLTVNVQRHDKIGGQFTFKCELSTSVVSDSHDMVCAYVPNCPDLKDRIDWLPLTKPTGNAFCKFLVRQQNEFKEERVSTTFGKYGHRYRDFYGGSYTTKLAQKGACMGMLILDAKKPTITGFHIGGNAETHYGVMQTIIQSEANALIAKLEAIPGVLLSANAVDIPLTQYDKKLVESDQIHPHCMASKLGPEAFVDIIGSTRLRTQQKSSVKPSILSDAVSEECGIPNSWGPPKLSPNWKAYNATLEHIVSPADMFAPSELERARQDWLKDLLPLAKNTLKPLTDTESVIGVPGVRFLDALPMSTGMGFPVFGKKRPHFEEIVVDKVLVDRVPSIPIQQERQRMRDCWKRNERAYPVCTATLKDEPTPVGKDKVRVFQAGAVALSLEVRKYFLPIARFLSLHPCESESAVGVNAFSTQWEDLMSHSNKYAPDDQVIAWDYSKYDVRMNSQMTRAVYMCFIDLAEAGGYPPDAISLMKAMVSDIVHPLMDYNGTMLMAYNMNTSGINVTVNVNSTAGSLYVRLGFFHEYPHATDFRSKVAAMTYGDDFKGSVHSNYRNFNFITYKTFLGSHGMKITLPDKGEDEVKFMRDEDADFLKRQTNFIPEINCGIGRLDEKSIFKSLHSNLASKSATPVEVSANCVETALHEWFAHGRETYDIRRTQLQRVCDKCELPVPALKFSFDDRVEHWKSKYKK